MRADYNHIHVEHVLDSTGNPFPLASLPQAFAYNEDDTLDYIEVTDGTRTWRQTYSYDDGKVSAISAWVPQS
jgi:hypothetical protein